MPLREQYSFIFPIEVRFHDLDALGHVNNTVYATYIEQARIAFTLQVLGGTAFTDIPFILAELTITYKLPAFFGDQLLVGVRVGRIGTKSFTMEHAIARGDETIATSSSVLVWYDFATNCSIPVPAQFREAIWKL